MYVRANLSECPTRHKQVSGDSVSRSLSQLMGYLLSESFHTSFRDVVCWIARRASNALLRARNDDETWLVTVDDRLCESITTIDDSPEIDIQDLKDSHRFRLKHNIVG